MSQYGRARSSSIHLFAHQVTTPTQPVLNDVPSTQPSHSPINSSSYQSVIEFAHFSLYQSTKLPDSVFLPLIHKKTTYYFLSKRSHCLDDGPTVDGPSLPPQFRVKLPGEIVDGDGQCEAHYGKGWKRFETVKLTCLILHVFNHAETHVLMNSISH